MSTPRSHRVVVLVAAACAAAAHATIAGAQALRTPDSKGYANVNGVELYYEVHGDGPPLIMLHGGVTPSEMFGAPLAWAERRQPLLNHPIAPYVALATRVDPKAITALIEASRAA